MSYAWPHAAETETASADARATEAPPPRRAEHRGGAQDRPVVLVRVQPAQDREGRAAVLEGDPPARVAQADVRLGHLRGRRLDQGDDRRDHRRDRRADLARPGCPPHRG